MQILERKNDYDILDNVTILDSLPIANYELCVGAFGRIYLNKIDSVELPEKIYANDTDFINHVLHSWATCTGNLGVGLIGKKGLGKSFTGNVIAKLVNKPIIRILNNPQTPEVLKFLKKIKQDFVLYIDEFEKIFPTKFDGERGVTQEDFLSFLDDGSEGENKILFIITANDPYKINDFLKNRPSRLKYFKEYNSLSDIVIREIVKDLLKYPEHKEDLLENLPYTGLNMDVLIQIIMEINTHNKPYSFFKDFFNFSEPSIQFMDIYTRINGVEYLIAEQQRGTIYSGDLVGKSPTGISLFAESSFNTENALTKDLKLYYYIDENEDNDDTEELPLIVKPVANKLAAIF